MRAVIEYVADLYVNEPPTYKRVASGRTSSKNKIIVEMARLKFSHLDIPTVRYTAKQTIKKLDLLT